MRHKTFLFKIVLPLVILAAGIVSMVALTQNRTPPERDVPVVEGALVETFAAQQSDHQVSIFATATVQPRHEASLAAQVSGRVVKTAPALVVGGVFQKGDLLFALEDIDYQLAVERAEAALTRARLDLRTMEGQARVARREWEQLGLEGDPDPLVIYEPQMENARANVASARAQRDQALLDLERTRVFAPFNGRITRKELDLGQYVNAGSTVAVIAGTKRAEVIVPLPVEDLARLSVPRPGSSRTGSSAVVRLRLGERDFEWTGRVVRSLGEVDPQGRMARLVVDLRDPYNLQQTWTAQHPALEPGMFVTVELKGEHLKDVIAVPREALRENDTLWVVAADDTLSIRSVDVVHRERQTLYLRGDVKPDERIILTPLSGAADGMKLRLKGEER